MNVYERLKELHITLPEPAPRGGLYSPCQRFGDKLVYVSGCGPAIGGEDVTGRLGEKYTVEEGKVWARKSMLNVLAALEAEIGDLNKVKKPVKTLAFVASTDDFTQQPQVANGGSQILADLFGEENIPARSAIGVNILPGNIPVETEAIFELKEE